MQDSTADIQSQDST